MSYSTMGGMMEQEMEERVPQMSNLSLKSDKVNCMPKFLSPLG